jgi:hypothetical protein
MWTISLAVPEVGPAARAAAIEGYIRLAWSMTPDLLVQKLVSDQFDVL